MLSDTSKYSGVAIHLKALRVQKYTPKVRDMEAHYLPIQTQNFGNKIHKDYKTKKNVSSTWTYDMHKWFKRWDMDAIQLQLSTENKSKSCLVNTCYIVNPHAIQNSKEIHPTLRT